MMQLKSKDNQMGQYQMNPDFVKALCTFQASCPTIVKDKTARVVTAKGASYQYSYAALANIFAAIRKPLAEAGLAVTQSINGDSLLTQLWHVSGESIESNVTLHLNGLDPQSQGKLLTYMRRYALSALIGIAAEDDTDAEGISERRTQQHSEMTFDQQRPVNEVIGSLERIETYAAFAAAVRAESDLMVRRGEARERAALIKAAGEIATRKFPAEYAASKTPTKVTVNVDPAAN